MYRTVQTGPKIQFGGLMAGWFSEAYHSGIAFEVKRPETAPIKSGKEREIRSLIIFMVFMWMD